MDKNTIIGFVLIAGVLVGYGVWTQPSAEQRAEAARQDSIAAVEQERAQAEKMAQQKRAEEQRLAAAADTTTLLGAAKNGTAQDIVLENSKVRLTLSTKGGTVETAVVKGFTDNDGNPDVTLFSGDDQSLAFILSTKEENINTADLYFTPSDVTRTSVTMTAGSPEGKHITIEYELNDDYLLGAKLSVNGMDGVLPANYSAIDINWSDRCKQQERGFSFENRYSTLTYHFVDGGTKHLSEGSANTDKKTKKPTNWVAFKSQFFSAVMIVDGYFEENASLTSIPQKKETGYLKDYNAKLKTAFDRTGAAPTQLHFYFGPNDFRLLQRVERENLAGRDLQLQRLVYLGWPIIRLINRWFIIYVFDFLTGMNISMGIVLILLTLLLKIITYPFVKKSYMSSAKMRVLRPKLDEATKQYNKPEDQMMKQQAMMAEYSKYGVSPMSGCLPMLVQMPIWLAMFNFVPNAIQLRGESFLWIKDLSSYDPIVTWGTDLWLIGDHLSLSCVLFCAANFLYTFMTMRLQKDQMVGQQAEQMKMMRWVMYLMPLMFFFVFNNYSAGLNFFYFVSLFFSASIMWLLRKTTNDAKLLAILEARYKENKDKPTKMTGLAARLQAMQEQQQELQRKREEAERRRNGK